MRESGYNIHNSIKPVKTNDILCMYDNSILNCSREIVGRLDDIDGDGRRINADKAPYLHNSHPPPLSLSANSIPQI